MGNKLIEDLGKGQVRETDSNAPAVENVNARKVDIGTFRQDDVAASQTDADLTLNAVDGNAPTEFVAPRAGRIVGLTARLSAAITAGTADLSAGVNGTRDAQNVNMNDTDPTQQVSAVLDPIVFGAGDRLGVQITTDGAFAPDGSSELQASLEVIWDPQ